MAVSSVGPCREGGQTQTQEFLRAFDVSHAFLWGRLISSPRRRKLILGEGSGQKFLKYYNSFWPFEG